MPRRCGAGSDLSLVLGIAGPAACLTRYGRDAWQYRLRRKGVKPGAVWRGEYGRAILRAIRNRVFLCRRPALSQASVRYFHEQVPRYIDSRCVPFSREF